MIKYVKRVVLGLIIIGAIAGGVWYCMQPETLIVVVAGKNTISPEVNGTGRVSGNKSTTVYADVTGVVDSRNVQVGDRVSVGDNLVDYVVDSHERQVQYAKTEAEYSKLILDADKSKKAKYEKMMNDATAQINNCAMTYTSLEQEMRKLSNETYKEDRFITQSLKEYESDELKLQARIAEKQQDLAQVEVELKKIELLSEDEYDDNDRESSRKNRIDKKVDKATDLHEQIVKLQRELSDIQVDKLTLPVEGMNPENHEKYLELQANMETVLKIWNEAKSQKEFAQTMLLSNGDIYGREQQVMLYDQNLANVEKELNKAKAGTSATSDGIVTACYVDKGAAVEKGAPMVVIETDDDYVVKMKVSKYDVASIKEGQMAEIRIGDKVYSGKVSKIQQTAENDASGKAKAVVEIKIDTTDKLIVGLEADVTLKLDEEADALSIPLGCVYDDDNGSYIYVLEDGIVTKKYVETGVSDNDMIAVSGISVGDHVIMDPQVIEYVGEEVKEVIYEQ